jgi:hypothetical protein
MTSTKLQILQAACDICGGSRDLAARLGISEALVRKCLTQGFELPDHFFLGAVDVILEDRESLLAMAPTPPGQAWRQPGAED